VDLTPIPSLFQPVPAVSPDAVVSPGPTLPLVIRTPAAQWAYAVQFKRKRDVPAPSAPLAIRVVVAVNSGTVGIGCLTADKRAFIDESLVSATASPVTADVVVSRASDAGALVIRNASSDGASEARLIGVECVALTIGQDGPARTPGLSEPVPSAEWSRYYGTRGTTIEEKLRVQTFLSAREPLVIQWADGLSFRILPGDQLSRALFVSGTYEPNTLAVLRRFTSHGDTFLDIGANTGVVSLAASKWVGAEGLVYSFEPSRREYDNLLHNVERNSAANIVPLRLAVAASTGEATLRIAPPSHAGLNTLGTSFSYSDVDTYALDAVETITLDDFIDRRRISTVSVMKVDVEGTELAVLQGAPRLLHDVRPAIVLEVLSRSLDANGATRASLEQLLHDARYRLASIDDATGALAPIETLLTVDEQNVVALPSERARFDR
jgi:FkbM family methyltransferase